MREILFKGQKIGDKEWAYGFYKYNKLTKEHCIESKNNFVTYAVIPETVEHFTGKRDKYWNRIYTNDLVKNGEDIILIRQDDTRVHPYTKNKRGEWKRPTNWRRCELGEVIGSMHDKEVGYEGLHIR